MDNLHPIQVKSTFKISKTLFPGFLSRAKWFLLMLGLIATYQTKTTILGTAANHPQPSSFYYLKYLSLFGVLWMQILLFRGSWQFTEHKPIVWKEIGTGNISSLLKLILLYLLIFLAFGILISIFYGVMMAVSSQPPWLKILVYIPAALLLFYFFTILIPRITYITYGNLVIHRSGLKDAIKPLFRLYKGSFWTQFSMFYCALLMLLLTCLFQFTPIYLGFKYLLPMLMGKDQLFSIGFMHLICLIESLILAAWQAFFLLFWVLVFRQVTGHKIEHLSQSLKM